MRLIDADALKNRLTALVRGGTNLNYCIADMIDRAPTIEPEVKFIRLPNDNPVDMFPLLTEEEKQQSREYAQGYSDALADMRGEQP